MSLHILQHVSLIECTVFRIQCEKRSLRVRFCFSLACKNPPRSTARWSNSMVHFICPREHAIITYALILFIASIKLDKISIIHTVNKRASATQCSSSSTRSPLPSQSTDATFSHQVSRVASYWPQMTHP